MYGPLYNLILDTAIQFNEVGAIASDPDDEIAMEFRVHLGI
jgi:hypothetical protein